MSAARCPCLRYSAKSSRLPHHASRSRYMAACGRERSRLLLPHVARPAPAPLRPTPAPPHPSAQSAQDAPDRDCAPSQSHLPKTQTRSLEPPLLQRLDLRRARLRAIEAEGTRITKVFPNESLR